MGCKLTTCQMKIQVKTMSCSLNFIFTVYFKFFDEMTKNVQSSYSLQPNKLIRAFNETAACCIWAYFVHHILATLMLRNIIVISMLHLSDTCLTPTSIVVARALARLASKHTFFRSWKILGQCDTPTCFSLSIASKGMTNKPCLYNHIIICPIPANMCLII